MPAWPLRRANWALAATGLREDRISMESHTSEARTALKERLLHLLQAGARGAVLASLTLATPSNSEAARSPERQQPSLEDRVQNLREPAGSDGSPIVRPEGSSELLAWGNWHNWHNWRNGWHNGWHNWHNWHNWW